MNIRATKRLWIAGVGTGALAMVAGLAVVTHELSRAEELQAAGAREAVRDDMVREALWRMDGTMAPLLASESLRPPADYEAFRSPAAAVNRMLQKVPSGEVLTPSPLLSSTPDWIVLHFQWRQGGGVTSPQVPEGNLRDLAEGAYLKEGVLESRAAELERVEKAFGADAVALEACTVSAEAQQKEAQNWRSFTRSSREEVKGKADAPEAPDARARADLAARAQTLNEAQVAQMVEVDTGIAYKKKQVADEALGAAHADAPLTDGAAGASSTTQVGALVPVWVPRTDPPLLVCIRRVVDGSGVFIQGFLVDWQALAPRLLARTSDLMERGSLAPVAATSGAFIPTRMATLPVELVPGVVFAEQRLAPHSSARAALLLAWAAGLGAILIAVAAAASAIRFGDRQARFASSVTHELRTPLTTFRLYSEMLRDGMVADPARLQECHDTLVRESVRLSHLVENVLSLSRIERGGAPSHPLPQDLGGSGWRSLLQAILAESAPGARCTVEVSDAIPTVTVDLGTITPIVANLASNAAKYGVSADGIADITVALRCEGRALVLAVRDLGAGVPRGKRGAIWRAFERAGAEASPHAGIGLGLPLARALAQRAGGTLTLRDTPQGACFELRLESAVGGHVPRGGA